MQDLSLFPKFTIITPTYNQGKFIEETILSVLGQNYPNLEYFIFDGGSTDNTIDIIKKYEKEITYWESKKDKGQSHAINKGFEKSTGEIIGWLNSDDLYMPNTLCFISEQVKRHNDKIYFGNCVHYSEGDEGVIAEGSDVVNISKKIVLENADFIIQPSSFWTKGILQKVGPLKEDIHYAFDWEWFLRAKLLGVDFFCINKPLSLYRKHAEHKTSVGGEKRQKEILEIYKQYSQRFAKLYENILNEDLKITQLKGKIVRRALKVLKRPNSNIDILRLLKSDLYKEYSPIEISNAISML